MDSSIWQSQKQEGEQEGYALKSCYELEKQAFNKLKRPVAQGLEGCRRSVSHLIPNCQSLPAQRDHETYGLMCRPNCLLPFVTGSTGANDQMKLKRSSTSTKWPTYSCGGAC